LPEHDVETGDDDRGHDEDDEKILTALTQMTIA